MVGWVGGVLFLLVLSCGESHFILGVVGRRGSGDGVGDCLSEGVVQEWVVAGGVGHEGGVV